MNDYSQHEEQRRILEFFEHSKQIGAFSFWDIGAGDGITNSNTRALSDAGWYGLLFEPLHSSFVKLASNYAGRNAEIYNLAVGPTAGFYALWTHPTLPEWSSMDETWIKPWGDKAKTQCVYRITIAQIMEMFRFSPNFVSIDTEGLDAAILESAPAEFTPELIVAEIDKAGAHERISAEMERRHYAKIWETVGNAAYERKA